MFFIFSFVAMPSESLIANINTGKYLYDLSKVLKSQYGIQGNIASNNNWWRTLYLSYYLNGRYYGKARKNISKDDLRSDLNKNNIDYYFVWNKPGDDLTFLSNYSEITGGEISNLRIYSFKGPPQSLTIGSK